MNNFTIHHIRVTAVAQTPVHLNEHKGSAIRGALFHALRGPHKPAPDGYGGFCANKTAPSCWECPLHVACPVSRLVATLDTKPAPNMVHGRQAPRPYIIRPPLEPTNTYEPGDPFTFTLGICADALQLFPYVVMALERLNHEGLGKRTPANNYQRGRLQIQSVSAIHPLTHQEKTIRDAGQTTIHMPDIPATHADILHRAAQLPTSGQLTLHFKTPTRLISKKKLLKKPHFSPLLLRLITRLEQLSHQFSDTPLQLDVPALLALAENVQLVEHDIRWEELESYSTRRRGRMHIGGFIGTATYKADDWQPFLPWLLWGTLVGIGKNTVKGDGWYTIQ